jgi:hypothetical protein
MQVPFKTGMRRTDNPTEDLQMTEIIGHYSIIQAFFTEEDKL